MFTIWLIFHVLVSISLILVVLLQSSKGEGLAGSAFGGGGGGLSGAVFGGRGAATFLSKATTVLAILFMINCSALAFMSSTTRVSTATGTDAESVVTKRAQEDRDRMMQEQQQQQQQQLVIPSDTAGPNNIQITPGDAPQQQPEQPSDSAGN